MLLGIVSDTHVNANGKRRLAPELFEHFQGVHAILHAGDLNCLRVITELEALAPIYAVYGNNEDFDARAQLPQTQLLTFGGVRIGLAHGDLPKRGEVPPLSGIYASGLPGANALSHFADAPIEVLVFGHSHWPLIQWHTRDDGSQLLLLNPGSAGKKRKAPHHSCALLQLDSLEARLVTWD